MEVRPENADRGTMCRESRPGAFASVNDPSPALSFVVPQIRILEQPADRLVPDVAQCRWPKVLISWNAWAVALGVSMAKTTAYAG